MRQEKEKMELIKFIIFTADEDEIDALYELIHYKDANYFLKNWYVDYKTLKEIAEEK